MPSITCKGKEENNYEADTDVDIDNLLPHAETLVRQVKVELNSGSDKLLDQQDSIQYRPKRKRSSHVETATTTTSSKKEEQTSLI